MYNRLFVDEAHGNLYICSEKLKQIFQKIQLTLQSQMGLQPYSATLFHSHGSYNHDELEEVRQALFCSLAHLRFSGFNQAGSE